ncbi:AAA family ATPase [Cellulomonas bogoriensis]|uniref:ATPase n=1 Tax=Cellulomonas bogoriensis 69B4 = DSM 16987 TaxID=1386082 RepID=A0A0A0BU78_9CELL|nr:MoxR family ATPase [Cellulomonas bogoriensis]KGM11968.1 ATPase [Cellulomonas bogoriensis 69B4 = DSM 16987]
MSITPEQSAWFAETFDALVANVGRAVLGKDHVVRLALTAMLAEGHLLLEDAPGTGKTSLAKALAATVQGTHSRIQFTPDLLPSDVTGVTIYDQSSRTFEFHQGPVFASVVLADEINRASPKTQSALLEVMEESKVTVDKVSHPVGRPFMVIATQNPVEQAGTYRLPEAQLDRFLIKTSLGYPDHRSTVEILTGSADRDRTAHLKAKITTGAVADMAVLASTVHTDTAVLDYVARLVEATRADSQTSLGVSVRGAIALVRCAKVWAASQGRGYVIPDDVKLLAEPVLAHRLILDTEAEFAGVTASQVVGRILADVEPPASRVD